MTLTSESEMRSIGGDTYIDLRIDDLDSTDKAAFITNVITEATEEVMTYLIARYEESSVTNIKLVRRWATIVALYFASQRRGNASQYMSEYESAIENLEAIAANERMLDAPTRSDLTPSVTNFVMDERYQIAKQRVRDELSSGGNHPNRKGAEYFPLDWI